MRLVLAALSRPVTVVIAVVTLAIASALAVRRMPADIFPELGDPAIYVAQPYGGMDPAQMDGFLTYYYEYHFLYVTGIEHIEAKSIQGVALMKLVFHAGTDMNQAMAQVVGYANRARAFMPPGAVPPFITRFDAGSVPIGQLVFASENRPPGEMQDIALNRVRPLFATLPGVSAPPPFGGNQRTIVVRLDPDRLRAYRISPEEAIAAVSKASTVLHLGQRPHRGPQPDCHHKRRRPGSWHVLDQRHSIPRRRARFYHFPSTGSPSLSRRSATRPTNGDRKSAGRPPT